MKAICIQSFGGSDVMCLQTVEPRRPQAGQIRVRIKVAGVNPVDTYIRQGLYPLDISLPFTPGMDGAGVVEEVGEGVTRFAPGDKVYVSGTHLGTYAEETVCSIHEAVFLPEAFSFAQGAAIGIPFATAYRALFTKAQAVDKETVMVHGGSGGVGTAVIQIAKCLGLTVIATAGSDKGRSLIQSLGADLVLDHTSEHYRQEVLDFTRGRGVQIIIEMLANKNLSADLQMLAPNSRVVIVGCRGEVTINPREAMSRDATICGMSLLNLSAEERLKVFQALDPYFQNGSLSPVIGREFTLQEAPLAHDAIMQSGASGKIVLRVES
ncbi:MAG TPA: NADPH:quinone reductase [Candidatus Omnitrophota bacterium]|nr:NADPH:quinone reductase [Candidatus Omnitrophota bacterium]HQO58176.1 NADPH:quinone reductase [Candidatus Omnitrophota bacterium]HQP13059.1 NADPH:quinone reductase [Candidatus Omnitrophota bacterium]